jgi:membrane protease YdiL (CAAX protease family)
VNAAVIERIRQSPTLLRVVPFAVFVVLTYGQGMFGATSIFWMYLLKTVVGVAMLRVVWPLIAELRWKVSWEAVVAGVGVFAIWVGLDGLYPNLNGLIGDFLCALLGRVGLASLCPSEVPSPTWNPHDAFGQGSTLAWFFIAVRLLGSSLVVPPLEEVFYRSFLYRYVIDHDFDRVSLGAFHLRAFLLTSLFFGFAHHEWLAAILCAFAFQGLVIWRKRLGDAMVAHAITNFLLALWVVTRGAWHFW